MTEYERVKPSIDVSLEEIALGKHRVRIIGTVVSVSSTSIMVNDGTGQVHLAFGLIESAQFEVQQLGRFVAEVNKDENDMRGTLLGWNPLTSDQAKRYRRIIKLERKLSK